jgi:glycosyltransferase involved in cell wall biosynthesis
MKLNWFSPLLPAKSGIANYTSHLMPALAARAQVTLWTDQAEWDPALETHARVRTFDAQHIPWREVNEAQMSIYHVGNNVAFHQSIWQLSRKHPGIVVLHDLSLQHFFGGVYREGGNAAEYLTAMARYYGQAGSSAAGRFLTGDLSTEYMAERFPLTPLAVENALGVLVHNREGLGNLKSHNRWPVACAPLPFPATPRKSTAGPEMLYKYWVRGPYRLIVFGYIGPNRRLDSVFEALAGHPHREQFRLDLVGDVWDLAHVQKQIGLRGLQDLVQLHGFLPDAALDQMLASAHLAVNLRYPTMGETSYCQLRIWDQALPSLVTPVGWYSTIPDEAAGFVRPENEAQDIRDHLSAFIADPSAYAAKGENGRRILEERHTPDAYAQVVVDFATELQGARGHALVYRMAERVSAELGGWSGPYLQDHGVRKVAEEIVGLLARPAA